MRVTRGGTREWRAPAARGAIGRGAALVCAVLACVSGGAAAQDRGHEAVAPATGVGAALDARYQSVDGLGASALRALQLGLGGDVRLAPVPGLELGAGWGARASFVSVQGLGGRARAGLPPLRLWVGTGGRAGRFAFGLRLSGGASPSVVGADAAASNGEWAFAELEGVVARRWEAVTLAVRAAAGAAYAGSTALSGVGRLRLGADLGGRSWRVRPYVEGGVAVATDLGLSGEVALGATLSLGRSSLRAVVGLSPWHDPSTTRARLTVSWYLDLDPAPPRAPGGAGP